MFCYLRFFFNFLYFFKGLSVENSGLDDEEIFESMEKSLERAMGHVRLSDRNQALIIMELLLWLYAQEEPDEEIVLNRNASGKKLEKLERWTTTLYPSFQAPVSKEVHPRSPL